MPGHAQQVNPAGPVLDHECRIQPGQEERTVHVQEADGQDGPGVGAQEGVPLVVARGRRRDPPTAQDLAYRARADPVSETAQLALDPDDAPGPVFVGEADDQLDEFFVERWPSR